MSQNTRKDMLSAQLLCYTVKEEGIRNPFDVLFVGAGMEC
jgi:hypothetical protein